MAVCLDRVVVWLWHVLEHNNAWDPHVGTLRRPFEYFARDDAGAGVLQATTVSRRAELLA